MYTGNAVCCASDGLVVDSPFLQYQLVCSQPTVMPPERCFQVTSGAPNFEVGRLCP